MSVNLFFSVVLFFSSVFCSPDKFAFDTPKKTDDTFLLGNEVLLSKNSFQIKDKRLGLITNASGVMSNGALFLDSLNNTFTVTKIFTPEHGLRVDDKNENYVDGPTGLPVVSLYGSKKKPDANDLANVDVLVYDIQDVGARFYTFINTMYFCIEAAFDNDKEIIICDRPMIPDANYVDGFMLDEGEESFVGMLDVPIAYGMTCGELAAYINSEYFNNKCMLSIIKMENYSRETDYSSLTLPWVKPSPNIYFPSSAVSYLGTCLFEGTNFAEGRGTDRPFEYIGAPYCDGNKLADELNSYNLSGVSFESIIIYTDRPLQARPILRNMSGEFCEGVYIKCYR